MSTSASGWRSDGAVAGGRVAGVAGRYLDSMGSVGRLLGMVACGAHEPDWPAGVRVSPDVPEVPANLPAFVLTHDSGVVGIDFRAELLDAAGDRRAQLVLRGVDVPVPSEAVLRPTTLVPGETVRVVVDGAARSFLVSPEDHRAPVWAEAVVARANGGVVVRFAEPMAASGVAALTLLAVGAPVVGAWGWSDGQRTATFLPNDPTAAPTHLSVGHGIADLAGNRLADRPIGPRPIDAAR